MKFFVNGLSTSQRQKDSTTQNRRSAMTSKVSGRVRFISWWKKNIPTWLKIVMVPLLTWCAGFFFFSSIVGMKRLAPPHNEHLMCIVGYTLFWCFACIILPVFLGTFAYWQAIALEKQRDSSKFFSQPLYFLPFVFGVISALLL